MFYGIFVQFVYLGTCKYLHRCKNTKNMLTNSRVWQIFCNFAEIFNLFKDKTFRISIPEAEIKSRVKALAEQISKDKAGKKPLFLGVLNGSFIFAADLMREMTIPCEISFVKLASYQGTTSTGKIHEVLGINEDLTNRVVIIVEDIVESGQTMKRMIESLGTRNPASVHICTLFFKPDKLKEELKLDYVAFRIPDDFIVGYGLDYDQQGRELKDIYTIVE